MKTPSPQRSRFVAFLALAVFAVAACSTTEPPVVTTTAGSPAASAGERTPVVLVPGITGSGLRHRESGEARWGRGPEVISPKDGGYALVRPLGLPLGDPTRLEATQVIRRLELFGGLVRKQVYGPVLDTLEANGWIIGDLEAPLADATAFSYAYDWRGDNVRSAQGLVEALRRLAAARGDAPLNVDLICQSNGAHICRWAAKYGDASLRRAEAGRASPLGDVHIRKLVLVGTSNGGSLRILREVHRGRRYVPFVGRRMLPETLFSFPAVFQDLPSYRPQPFVDEDGLPLELDLFDAETWVRHGFSAFRADARARMDARPDLFGSEAERVDHLRRSLDRARRLHALLARDVDGFDSRYYLIQNGYEASAELAVLRRRAGDRTLLFTGDAELEDDEYLHRLVSSPGDGHATFDSQQALSPQERRALDAPTFFVRGSHFELILEPSTLRRIVELLLAE